MPRPLHTILIPLILAIAVPPASLLAQDKLTTSPRGWNSSEGNDSGRILGAFSTARYQFLDGELKGLGVKLLKQVQYRHDWQYYIPQTGAGRTWSQVKLAIGEGDYAKQSTTWSHNRLSTPTRVFDASIAWPDMNGYPSTGTAGPAPFHPGLAFPFSTSWSYSGKRDILLEYVFVGGKLKNGMRWVTATESPYHMDSVRPVIANRGGTTTYGRTTCTDSGQPSGASCTPAVTTYAANTGNRYNTNQHFVYTYSLRTAKNAPVIHALTTTGSTTGVTIPLACNKLFVNLGGAPLYFSGIADNIIGSYSTSGALGYFPYTPAAVGIPIWVQAAWADSVNKNLMLTNAAMTTVPPQPPDPPRRAVQYDYQLNSVAGPGFTNDPRKNAIARYTYR